MKRLQKTTQTLAFLMFGVFMMQACTAQATERAVVEAEVRAQVIHDLAALPDEHYLGRTCLDGRVAENFPGEVVEYWVNLECAYCGIAEPMQAQRNNAGLCVVVRHIPTSGYDESLKKALSYEALKKFSTNGANLFWEKIIPKNSQAMPVPYEASLLLAFQEAAIAPEAFAEVLAADAATIVNTDIAAAEGRIASTPTYILAGIRFGSCDFTAAQLPIALELAQKARQGDTGAMERIVTIITNGRMNEEML